MSPRGLCLKDQQGTSSVSDRSGPGAVTTENFLEAVSQLSSNLSLDSKRNVLLRIKANQPNLFTDLQIYLQVIKALVSVLPFLWSTIHDPIQFPI